MLLFEVVRVALDALRVNKLRSLLTMLGIVIGVGAVISMIALGNGAQASVQERINGLGTTLLQVVPQRVTQAGVTTTSLRRLTPDDAKAIAERSTHITEIEPEETGSRQVVWKNKNTNVQITGATPNFLGVRRFAMAGGRMFTESEDAAHRRVAVLGAGVLPLLGILYPEEVLGEDVRIAGEQFTVIGVLQSKGQTSSFGNPDEQILVPFSTARFKVFGTNWLNNLYALAESEDAIPDAMGDIESAMRRAHRLKALDPDDFQIRNQSDFLTSLSETTQTFTILLAGIAAVSLLVGGIGIMNIMPVSVMERTREIGIRKALGATRSSILLQSLAEAVMLCAVGGLLGVGAGAGASAAFHRVMAWSTAVDSASIVLAFSFGAATGLVFGVLPARRAASLDPIQALRYG